MYVSTLLARWGTKPIDTSNIHSGYQSQESLVRVIGFIENDPEVSDGTVFCTTGQKCTSLAFVRKDCVFLAQVKLSSKRYYVVTLNLFRTLAHDFVEVHFQLF